MNKTVILLFLAVFAVYQVQGYSLYDRLFQDEERGMGHIYLFVIACYDCAAELGLFGL